jgi:hypothetical protein
MMMLSTDNKRKDVAADGVEMGAIAPRLYGLTEAEGAIVEGKS